MEDKDKEQQEALSSNRKRKLKALVLTSLVGGGALGLAGWNAQAHGNRSSHVVTTIQWSVDDYVIDQNQAEVETPEATDQE